MKVVIPLVISGNVSSKGKHVLGNVNNSITVNGDVNKGDNIYVKELHFENRYNFPNIGKSDMIYVATDENALYIFDTTQNIYHCVGRDYSEISAIKCQLKEE